MSGTRYLLIPLIPYRQFKLDRQFLLFPITLPQHWQPNNQLGQHINNPALIDWVTSESSLTVRVKELGIAFNLQVLNQSQISLNSALQQQLQTTDTQAVCREVLLKQGDIALVYAQTLIPQSTVTGTEKMLAELGNQPLGQVLFQSPQAVRGDIEFSIVEPNTNLGEFITNKLNQPMQHTCVIRRSLFHLNNKPLMVHECFLPALFD